VSHELPLGRQARGLLEALPRAGTNPFLFPGCVSGAPLSVAAIDQAWRRIRQTAGVEDARLHDLRRTLGSWVVQQTGSLALTGALLGHSDPRVTAAHYARFADENRRSALDAHSAAVLAAAGVGSALNLAGLAAGKGAQPDAIANRSILGSHEAQASSISEAAAGSGSRKGIEAGHFQSVDEVECEPLRLVQDRQALFASHREELRAPIAEGGAAEERGELRDVRQVIADVRAGSMSA